MNNPNLIKLKNLLSLNGIKDDVLVNYNHVIMIHELNLELIQYFNYHKDLFQDCIFTFDDGLYSQFFNYWRFEKLFPTNPKFYFVSTNLICKERNHKQRKNINCSLAHKMAFEEDDVGSYMKLSQIKTLSENPFVYIGGHGHNHLHAGVEQYNGNLKDKYQTWLFDFKKMVTWFNTNNFKLEVYCTPYNEYNFLFHGSVKKQFPEINIIGPNRLTPKELVKLKIPQEK